MPLTPQRTKQETIEEVRIFADAYNPAGIFPVPIVPMIERMGVDILELPGLRNASGVAGQVSNDLSEIQVDAAMYTTNLDAYRHTIAHETAHLILHGDFILSLGIVSKQSWKSYLAQQDPQASDQMEKEAAIFARYVLVPTQKLQEMWNAAASDLSAVGRDIEKLTDESLSVVAGNIARRFRVPTWMVERRLRDERLAE